MGEEEIVVICLSGRGDKDVQTVRDALGGGRMTKKTLKSAIRACVNRKDKAFVPYIMAGDGGLGDVEGKAFYFYKKQV